MTTIDMPFPKTCNDCNMFEFDGDYPTCRATLSATSSGYNFPYRDKRMSFCPLTEKPDFPKIYLVVIGETPNTHVLRIFLDKKKAEVSAKNTEGAHVVTYFLSDPDVTLKPEPVDYYSIVLSAKGEPLSVLHLTRDIMPYEEKPTVNKVEFDTVRDNFICLVYNTDEREEAVEEALNLRKKWIASKYGM